MMPNMKIKSTLAALLLSVFALMSLSSRAATTNLTALLQQGLFEEQANRNLDAAIEDYATLAKQFDKDRQLAATAVFRLGECYRAQGKTNEAATYYQRILRDFSDQTTLATLSRQNLAGMGAGKTEAPATMSMENPDALLLKKLEDRPTYELVRILPTLLPDSSLDELLKQRNDALSKRASLITDYSTNNPAVVRVDATLAELEKQIEEKISGMMAGLKLRAEISPSSSVSKKVAQKDLSPSAKSDEDKEIERIEKMIQNSPDLINSEDGRSAAKTPLIQAAWAGWLKVAAYLLDHGADVNRSATELAVNSDLQQAGSVSPLFAAVASGNKAMTALLIERGAEVNFKASTQETTPLHLAARKGFQAVVEVLLASHADVNAKNKVGQTPLFFAVQGGQIKIVQMLIAAGADPNLRDVQDNTVLKFAIKTSQEMFKILLAAGVDPNTVASSGRTPLSYVAENDSAAVVKLLLDAKADPNGGKQDAPLLVAIHANKPDTAELLLQAGAKPNAFGSLSDYNNRSLWTSINRKQITPLWLAIYEDQLPMVKLLLKYKADPNDAQTEQLPVILKTLEKPEMLSALLEAGANVEVRDMVQKFNAPNGGGTFAYERTPLLKASELMVGTNAVELLLKYGANANAVDAEGNTPLHLAAVNLAFEETFKLLLEHKANPNLRNKNGMTPLDAVKSAMTYERWRFSQNTGAVTSEQKAFAEKMAALLRAHGALDKLPDWDRITVSRPAADFSQPVFTRGTNDWNHFTLLELLYAKYNNRSTQLDFADLSKIVVARPSASGADVKRIAVNLLNATNGVDVSRDIPLEFGDVVEIPERQHALSDQSGLLSYDEMNAVQLHLMQRAGEAQLKVAGSKTISLPLPHYESFLKRMLNVNAAQAVLTSSSDLSRVKVTRRDVRTGKNQEWVVDCAPEKSSSNSGLTLGVPAPLYPSSFSERLGRITSGEKSTDLWLRAGDVIEVPLKQ
jgi:ankyrin repeat protein